MHWSGRDYTNLNGQLWDVADPVTGTVADHRGRLNCPVAQLARTLLWQGLPRPNGWFPLRLYVAFRRDFSFDHDSFLKAYPYDRIGELLGVNPDAIRSRARRRDGCLLGRPLLGRYGWKSLTQWHQDFWDDVYFGTIARQLKVAFEEDRVRPPVSLRDAWSEGAGVIADGPIAAGDLKEQDEWLRELLGEQAPKIVARNQTIARNSRLTRPQARA